MENRGEDYGSKARNDNGIMWDMLSGAREVHALKPETETCILYIVRIVLQEIGCTATIWLMPIIRLNYLTEIHISSRHPIQDQKDSYIK